MDEKSDVQCRNSSQARVIHSEATRVFRAHECLCNPYRTGVLQPVNKGAEPIFRIWLLFS